MALAGTRWPLVAILCSLVLSTACMKKAGQAARNTPEGAGGEPVAFVLMTEEEAVEARVSDEQWVVPEQLRGAGPEIIIVEPDTSETTKGLTAEVGKPFDLKVRFEPAGRPVDMATLSVKAKVGFLPKVSLTSRLQPYIRETVLDGRALSVPKGKYLIEISVSDTSGATSMETIRVRVRE